MNLTNIYYVQFTKPIDFIIKITFIKRMETIGGNSIFVQGTEVSEGIHIEFYCPFELEHMLQQTKPVIGDTVKFEYFGHHKFNNKIQHQFFVEILEKNTKN